VGFDASNDYIQQARKRFPKARFACARVADYALAQPSYFDVVLALGIVHHLDDSEAVQLFRIAWDALKPGGKLVTLDGVWMNGQSTSARYLLARDRGQFIRTKEAYIRLASRFFLNIEGSVRNDLLRIPYPHVILECVR